MLRTVRLHGRLGTKFGRKHRLDVSTPAEAIRALCVLHPGFQDHVRKYEYAIVVGEDRPVTMDTLDLGFGRAQELHMIPRAKAAGLETILLVGTLVLTAALSVVTLLSLPKAPDADTRERDTKEQSFIFDGPVNVTEQGHPVPVNYGRVLVGSVVGSAGIDTTDINQSDIYSHSGSVGATPGFGGYGGQGGQAWESIQLNKGGKGGGGTTRSAQEEPNTLQSQAVAKIVDIIGEGEQVGLVDGLKSIFLDGTPVQNTDDSYNFAGIAVDERVGLPDQDPLPGYSSQESTTSVATEVTQLVGPITRTIQGSDTDVARVTIRLPSLYQQDTTNGDLGRYSVTIAISVQQAGGGFTEVVRHTFNGKTTSDYQRSFDIRLPSGAGPFDIRVTRISPDASLSSIQDETHWDLLTEIVEAKLIYPDTALVGLTVDARQFGTNIAERSYLVDGLIVEVPTNYDPVTRVYTGVWDGTFKRAWTDNPAWVFRDIVINNRYGLGDRVPETSVDKWGLYALSQYNDELVDDGFGGQEPRYTINVSIRKRAQAYDVLASIASNCRGWVYWGSGSVRVAQDRPEDPSILVNRTNVVEGKIDYDRVTPLEKRRSVAIVWWNDPADNYRLTPAIVEDDELIRRFGWEPREQVTAFGCTREGHATRFARLLLEDESQASNASASYAVGADHQLIDPGQIAEVSDPRFVTTRRGGRLAGSTANTVTLDSDIVLEAGQSYTFSVILPDGSVFDSAISTGAGTHTTLALTTAFTTQPINGAVWNVKSDTVANRQFRIRSIGGDEAPYAVRGIAHDPTKYARVEQGLDLDSPNFFDLPDGGLTPPGNISVLELLVRDGDTAVPGVLMSWEASTDPRVLFYQSQFRRPGAEWESFGDSSDLQQQLAGVTPGVWGFRVRALDALGRKTEWLVFEPTLDGEVDALPNPAPTITSDDVALTPVLIWPSPGDNRPLRYEVFFNAVDDFNTATSLGFTQTNEWPITEAGFYWVRSEFAGSVGTEVRVPVTAGDLPSPQWVRIDGAPQTLADLDAAASANITQLISDVDDLEATYGSTASAAASAAAAAADAAAAAASQTAAQTAQTAAETAQTAAELAETAAELAESNAATSATNAASSESAASTSAASASSSETLAATYRDDAERTLFEDMRIAFDRVNDFRTSTTFSDPLAGSNPSTMVAVTGDPDFGAALEWNTETDFRLRKIFLIEAGRKYQLSFNVKISDETGGSTRLRIRPRNYDSAGVSGGDAITGWNVYSSTLTVAGGAELFERELDGDTYLAANPSLSYLELWFLDDPSVTGSKFRIDRVVWEDITESAAAADSAGAALVSESNASASAGAASTSETNAAASAVTAATEAGNATSSATAASTSETNASTSESNAAASEALAASHETGALGSVIDTLPSDFRNDGKYYTIGNSITVGPTATDAPSSEFRTIADGTRVYFKTEADSTLRLHLKGALPHVSGNTYRLRYSVRTPTDIPGTLRPYFYFYGHDSDYSYVSVLTSGFPSVVTDGNWHELIQEFVGDGSTALIGGAISLFVQNGDPTWEVECRMLELRDVTSEAAAANSAAAALVSESNASASEGAASTSETNAAASAVTAATEAGNAASSATSASTSATNASASESNAATSASVAAGHATDAGSDAAAAATSASNASASEGNASTSETNAAASAVTATTQAGNAASSASSASTSETNASASESAAAASETLAASHQAAAASSASAASSSQSAAAASATSAATSESNAATSAFNATADAGTATAQAGIATTQATLAAAEAAAASSSASLSASLATGHINRNSRFSDYPNATGLPGGDWATWSSPSNLTRVAGRSPSPYAFQLTGQAGVTGGAWIAGHTNPDYADTIVEGGWYVVEAEVTLDAGTFRGAGVYLPLYNGTSNVSSAVRMSFTGLDANGTQVNDGVVGKTYRFAGVFQESPGTANRFILYLMNHWNSFTSSFNNGNSSRNDISAANTITWHMLGVRAATPAEIDTQTVLPQVQADITNESVVRASADTALAGDITTLTTTVNGNTASISTVQTAVNGIEARYGVTLDVNGYVTGFQLLNGTGQSQFKVKADDFLIETSSGDKTPFSVSADRIEFGADLHAGSYELIFDNGSIMLVQGVGFGANSDLLEWFGPSQAVNLCTKANATSYKATDGSAYFGGSLLAGTLTNGATNSGTTASEVVEIGPFGTNGNSKLVTVGYNYQNNDTPPDPFTCPGSPVTPSATIKLERSFDGTNWTTLVGGNTSTGTFNCESSLVPGEPGSWSENIGGGFTFTDTNTSTGNFYYRATMTARSVNYGLNPTPTQRLSVQSVEE